VFCLKKLLIKVNGQKICNNKNIVIGLVTKTFDTEIFSNVFVFYAKRQIVLKKGYSHVYTSYQIEKLSIK